MRLGCLLPVISVGLVIIGGQSVYTGLKNRKPTEVGIEALVAKKPSAEWLIIKDGVLDTMNSAYSSSFGVGDAHSVFVPLVPPKTDSSETKIHVLVMTKDPALVKFTNQAREFDKPGASETAAHEFILKNLDKMRVARTVQGLVKFGVEADDKETRKIRKLYNNLAADAIILEEGEEPSVFRGVVMFLVGLILGGVLLMSYTRKQATPASPPPLGPPPLP